MFFLIAFLMAFLSSSTFFAQDPVFSGPQAGEKLSSFKIRGVLEPDGGKEIDLVERANGKPLLLVFLHDVNRQSISMTRILTTYAKTRAKDGLTTGVIWLGDDATEAENQINRVKHALTAGVITGVSPDGREGPGSYGLNRKVMLTILVGNKNHVSANFALVQPSLQADLPKILEAITHEIGGKAPKLEDLPGMPAMPKPNAPAGPDANLRELIRPVIQLKATSDEVDQAARKLEEHCAGNEASKKEVGRIANTIINAGKLKDYGTPKAQDYLKKWAREYGTKKNDEKTPGKMR